MHAVARAFYSEPVLFLGVLQGVIAAAIGEGVLGSFTWLGVLAIAAIIPLQRRFATPASPGPDDLG